MWLYGFVLWEKFLIELGALGIDTSLMLKVSPIDFPISLPSSSQDPKKSDQSSKQFSQCFLSNLSSFVCVFFPFHTIFTCCFFFPPFFPCFSHPVFPKKNLPKRAPPPLRRMSLRGIQGLPTKVPPLLVPAVHLLLALSDARWRAKREGPGRLEEDVPLGFCKEQSKKQRFVADVLLFEDD